MTRGVFKPHFAKKGEKGFSIDCTYKGKVKKDTVVYSEKGARSMLKKLKKAKRKRNSHLKGFSKFKLRRVF